MAAIRVFHRTIMNVKTRETITQTAICDADESMDAGWPMPDRHWGIDGFTEFEFGWLNDGGDAS